MSQIVEPCKRTENDRMEVIFEINKNYMWIGILNNIDKDYNNSNQRFHSNETHGR